MTDNRVIIGLELEQDLLYQLMLMAHEQDITLNQMIERILREYLDRETSVPCDIS
jgi:predicted HicB family RNase H-like nuclease